ncbi:MAG: hypothetical protein JNJ59_06845 [Deltaproteobacteria bacterium]|nr:hypothetical protein [Deltaproteobacteria bacterium]
MRRLARPILLTAMTFGPLTSACTETSEPVKGQPIVIFPAAVQSAAKTNARAIAHELWQAQDWLGKTDSVDAIGDVFQFGVETDIPAPRNAIFLPEDEREFNEAMDDLDTFLEEHVFVDAQIESRNDTSITYKLDPQIACDADLFDLEDCQRFLTEMPIRIRATRFRESDVDLELLAGPDKTSLATLELHEDLAALTVDFASGAAVIDELVAVADGDDEDGPTVDIDGKARIAVRRLAEDKLRLESAVTEPIALKVDQGEEGIVEVTSALGTFALDVDYAASKATLDIDLGRSTVTAPKRLVQMQPECYEVWSTDADGNETYTEECDGETLPEAQGQFSLIVERLAVYAELDDTAKNIALKGLALGPIKVLSDAATAAELSIGGTTPFDLTLATNDDDTVNLSLSRAVEASAILRMGLLDDTFGDLPEWFRDEDLGLKILGEAPSLTALVEGIIVGAATTLEMTSRFGDPQQFSAEAGQCVWVDTSTDLEENESHPFDMRKGDTCPEPDAEIGVGGSNPPS